MADGFGQRCFLEHSHRLAFVKAYAINARGTTYSTGTSSFTTLAKPEPTVQASNIVFDRVTGGAMVIQWTRGNGDGSIVVIRQGVTRVDPVDGTDYSPDPEYPIGTEIPTGSGNYVVHRGTEARVWVTGLAQETEYTVAIYEYTNSGTDIDYLTPASTPSVPPEEDSRTTPNVPSHN